jgi:hypothetical protein
VGKARDWRLPRAPIPRPDPDELQHRLGRLKTAVDSGFKDEAALQDDKRLAFELGICREVEEVMTDMMREEARPKVDGAAAGKQGVCETKKRARPLSVIGRSMRCTRVCPMTASLPFSRLLHPFRRLYEDIEPFSA